MQGDAQNGANCMKGRELQTQITGLKAEVVELQTFRDGQREWNHCMDLRISKLEWRVASWAAGGAIIATIGSQVLLRLLA